MIKKQLGLLAGSVLVASSANAAVTLSGDAVAVFNTAGAGSYYQILTGVNGDSLEAGTAFSVDVSAATAALGGTIDSFAMFAINSNELSPSAAPGYNYSEFLYVSEGGGLVFAGDTATSTTNLAAVNTVNNVGSALGFADLGFNGEGSQGDWDQFAFNADFLTSGVSSVIFNQQNLTGATNAFVIGNGAVAGGVSLAGAEGLETFGTAVPVPAAAWLFGSALLGLGVVRRKK